MMTIGMKASFLPLATFGAAPARFDSSGNGGIPE